MHRFMFALGALLIVIAGCSTKGILKDPHEGHDHAEEEKAGKAAEETSAKAPTDPSEQVKMAHGTGAPDALGAPQGNETFALVLKADKEQPAVGENKFTAKVLHKGEAFGGATVKVATRMPDMGHDGPSFELKNTSGNAYEGVVKLPMAGKYEATVTLVSKTEPNLKAQFTYKFEVKK